MVVIQIKKKRRKREKEIREAPSGFTSTHTPKGFGSITAYAAESDPIRITLIVRLNLIGHSVVDDKRKITFQSFLWSLQFQRPFE